MRGFTVPALAASVLAGTALLTPVAAQSYNGYNSSGTNRNYGYQDRYDNTNQYPSNTQRYGQGYNTQGQYNDRSQTRSYGQDNSSQNRQNYGRSDNDRYNYGRNDNDRNRQNYGYRYDNQQNNNGQYGLGRSSNPGYNNRYDSDDND